MSRFVWACWDGGGNLTPSLGVARALTERGHGVTFIGRQEMLGRVQAAGFATRELTQAYALFDRLQFHPLARIFGYLSSPAVGEELVSAVRREAPDAVVIDAMFSAALEVAPQFSAPTAVMVHTFVRRMFPTWKNLLQMQSDGRVRGGFAPTAPFEELWGARDLVHSNSLAEFDGPADVPLVNLGHGAPVLEQEPRAIPPELPWDANDPAPLVLVSFSTVTEQRNAEKLQRALDALAPLPVRVVATTGNIVDPAELSAPANAAVLRFASHEALLPRTALVVTHGGHGTAMRCLRAGVPMVVVPGVAGDQPFVARAIEEWGAGRALAGDADVGDIRAAVEAVLGERHYRTAAERAGARLVEKDGAAAAATSLEGLVAVRAPSPQPAVARAGA